MDLILASTSRYRAMLLARLGVAFRQVDPGVDESAWKARLAGEPTALAEGLALAKARAAAADHPGAVIIGGDQVVAVGGAILGKPGTAERAERQLARIAGRAHELITALAVVAPGREPIIRVEVARLHARALDAAAIRRYVAADSPLDCAGSYKLEERGIALFERIEAGDHSAITGVPLMALTSILLDLGFAIP